MRQSCNVGGSPIGVTVYRRYRPRPCENARRLKTAFDALRFWRAYVQYFSISRSEFESIESTRIALGVFTQPRPEADISKHKRGGALIMMWSDFVIFAVVFGHHRGSGSSDVDSELVGYTQPRCGAGSRIAGREHSCRARRTYAWPPA